MSEPQREVRICTAAPIELRATASDEGEEGGGIGITGYAAVFGEATAIGPLESWGWEEVVDRGAFRAAVQRGDDVTLLVDHAGLPLARSSSGTLTLSEDERGLRVDTRLDASDPDVQRLLPKMKRGDLTKMSFGFIAEAEGWDETGPHARRSIRSVRLFDVSIVTDPAYQGTEIALRSRAAVAGARPDTRAVSGAPITLRMDMRLRLAGPR